MLWFEFLEIPTQVLISVCRRETILGLLQDVPYVEIIHVNISLPVAKLLVAALTFETS
jgi:hypothetical protein